jgi:hypothetical protein
VAYSCWTFLPILLGVSKLRRADYTQHLKGKTILRCEWTNDQIEHFICLSLYFSDETMCSIRLHQSIEEEVELQDYKGGNISNERLIAPTPIAKPKEAE